MGYDEGAHSGRAPSASLRVFLGSIRVSVPPSCRLSGSCGGAERPRAHAQQNAPADGAALSIYCDAVATLGDSVVKRASAWSPAGDWRW